MIVNGKIENIKVDITIDEIIKALKNEALGRNKGRVEDFYIKDNKIVCDVSEYENKQGYAVISADEKVVNQFKLIEELEKTFKE